MIKFKVLHEKHARYPTVSTKPAYKYAAQLHGYVRVIDSIRGGEGVGDEHHLIKPDMNSTRRRLFPLELIGNIDFVSLNGRKLDGGLLKTEEANIV